MTILTIKIIACISMLIDHLQYAVPFIREHTVLKCLGRLSFPLFAFGLVEGYVHTSDLKKYVKRLFIFGIISQIPFMYFRSLVDNINIEKVKMLNIMFTLLLGLAAIYSYDKSTNKILGFFGSIVIVVLGEVFHVDYGWYGVASCLVIFMFRGKNIKLTISYIALVIAFYIERIISATIEKGLEFKDISAMILYYIRCLNKNIYSIIVACSTVAIMILYNGQKGKSNNFLKYFFYVFYPMQCIAVFIIYQILN